MKKYLLSIFTILSFAGFALYERQSNSVLPPIDTVLVPNADDMEPGKPVSVGDFVQPTPVAQVPVTAPKSTVAPEGKTPKPAPVPATPTPTPAIAGKFRDGSYDGDIADVYYGLVQVRAVVKNGKLVDVVWLSYPNDNPTSAGKSARARPILTQEAIVAQDAQVDRVSGASATSGGFVDSLASALAQAKA
ncbi:MAG TPA: FMN-binding protein [Candidatus Paceibacterota bacterium]|nr:FMN-binding protein [Candidatus Paceibacterota bacterium]